MAKACMRPYYALGLLVAGIVLLYLFIQNVEPFLPAPPPLKGDNIKKVYFNMNNNGVLSYIKKDSDLTATVATNQITITLPTGAKLIDYGIYAYGTGSNCNNKYTFEKDSKSNCWYIISSGIQVTANIGNNSKSTLSSTTIGEAANVNLLKNPQPIIKDNKLVITGIKKASAGYTTSNTRNYENTANIRIDLSIA